MIKIKRTTILRLILYLHHTDRTCTSGVHNPSGYSPPQLVQNLLGALLSVFGIINITLHKVTPSRSVPVLFTLLILIRFRIINITFHKVTPSSRIPVFLPLLILSIIHVALYKVTPGCSVPVLVSLLIRRLFIHSVDLDEVRPSGAIPAIDVAFDLLGVFVDGVDFDEVGPGGFVPGVDVTLKGRV